MTRHVRLADRGRDASTAGDDRRACVRHPHGLRPRPGRPRQLGRVQLRDRHHRQDRARPTSGAHPHPEPVERQRDRRPRAARPATPPRGNSNVTAAEYSSVRRRRRRHAMTRQPTAPTVSLSATIPAGSRAGTTSVRSTPRTAAGNWGADATITLTVDSTGPVDRRAWPPTRARTTAATARAAATPSVRVTATFSDAAPAAARSPPARASSTRAGANGTGFPFTATDGVFNTADRGRLCRHPADTINAARARATTHLRPRQGRRRQLGRDRVDSPT